MTDLDTQTDPAEDTNEAAGTEVAVPSPTTQVVEVTNPNKEEMASISETIKVNYDFSVTVKPIKFNFKKSVDKDTNITMDRKPVELPIPVPSVDGIVAILEGGEPGDNKGLDLLLEAMEAVVTTAARAILQDGKEGLEYTAATFPVDKISWEFIANMPKAQRAGGGIPKEVWDAFKLDYIKVMPEVTGKTTEAVANAARILAGKLTQARTNAPVLQLLVGQLAVYAEHSPNVEEFQSCIEFLADKADKLLNITDEQMLANL